MENQIEKRKIGDKWVLSQNINQSENNSMKNKFKLNTIRDEFDKAYGRPKNIYKK